MRSWKITNISQSPIGRWAKNPHLKEVGETAKVALLESIEPYSLALFTRTLGQSYEDTQEYISKLREELLDSPYHLHALVHFVYGQRPMSG